MDDVTIKVAILAGGSEHKRAYEMSADVWNDKEECKSVCRELCDAIGDEIFNHMVNLASKGNDAV